MLINLPKVPCYTDQKGRPLGNALATPLTDLHVQHDHTQVEGQAPALWNALGVTFEGPPWSPVGYTEDAALTRSSIFGSPPSAQGMAHSAGYGGPVTSSRPPPATPHMGIYPCRTGLPTTLGTTVYTGKPAVSGNTSYGHHLSSIPGRASSFLDKNQHSKGDASASSSSTIGASDGIAISTILVHIQEVGFSTTVGNLVAMISTKRREATTADWHRMGHQIRMAVVNAFIMTLSGTRDIRVSPNDLKAAAAGYPDPTWSEATFRALHVAGLLIELTKRGFNSPGDVATAATQLFERRHCGGYLPLMHSLLQAACIFHFPYDAVMELRGKKGLLQYENGPWAKDINKAINNLRYPRQRRRDVVREV